MKQRKLAPLLAVTISFQMMVSPLVAIGEETKPVAPKIETPAPVTPPKKNTSSTSAAEIFSSVMTVGQAVLGQMNQNQISPMAQQDMAALQQQQMPQPDKFFNPQKLSKMPGLSQYLALNNINPQLLDCKTLPTTLHEAKNEVCRIGMTSDKNMSPQMQLSEMLAYGNQYTQINKLYKNFTADSNVEGQLFGVGCMKNAMQILNGFFQYRLNELDKLTTNLEAINNQFREASRSDLDAIEEAVAVLEGGDSDMVNKVKTKRPDLFDYSKRFNNQACISMFSKEEFNKMGKGGLNTINQTMKDTIAEKPPGSKFSGESYSQSHANVVADLNQLADKAAKQAELKFSSLSEPEIGYDKFLKDLPRSVSSNNGSNAALTPDVFADLQTKFAERNMKLQEDFNTINNELRAGGVNGGRALSLVRNSNATNFDNEVATIENQLKNKCLQQSLTGTASVDAIMEKIYDPSASGFANKNASNFLKDKLKQIMENDQTSPEKKLAELKSLESQQGNRYLLRMDNSYEVQDVDANGKLVTRVAGASTKRTPSVFFADVIRNCEAQFKVNQLDNKLSGSGAVQRLKKLNQDYKSLAKSHAQEVREEVRKKLIECADPAVANNSTPGSCDSSRFNTSSPGFCANAALSCSKNMQACSQQSEKFTSEIKKERTARVNNYKALAKKNKDDIVKIFDSALSTYMRDGELLRGAFGVGFSSPKDIDREVPEGSRYLDEFRGATSRSIDGALLLEDPDKYVAMFKRNIENLKSNVAQQQEQILGPGGQGGILGQHMAKTEKNYKAVERESERFAENCMSKHDRFISESEAQRNQMRTQDQAAMGELGEKLPRFCKKFETAREHPNRACHGDVSDLVSASIKAANRAGNSRDLSAITEFQDVCDGYNNESSEEEPDILTMCDKLKVGNKPYKYCNDEPIPESEKKFCKSRSVTVGTTTTSSEPDCSEFIIKQITQAYKQKHPNGSGGLVVTSSAPSFCTAADNSDPNNSKSQMNMMIKSFGNAFSNGSMAQ